MALIAETAILYSEGAGPGYTIVDAAGAPRRKKLRGKTVPLSIADLVAELRRDHPNLFGVKPASATSPAQPPVVAPPLAERVATLHADGGSFEGAPSAPTPSDGPTPAHSPPEQPRPRDWIRLGGNPPSPERPSSPSGSAAEASPSLAAAAALRVSGPAVVARSAAEDGTGGSPSEVIASSPPPQRGPARRYREPVAIRPGPAAPKPRLAGAWRPSQWVMRVLYIAAFVGGMAAYSAVRHLS